MEQIFTVFGKAEFARNCRTKWWALVIIVALLSSTACAAQLSNQPAEPEVVAIETAPTEVAAGEDGRTPEAEEADATPVAEDEAMETKDVPAVCSTPADGQSLLLIEEEGFCLLYPDHYSIAPDMPETTELVIGDIMNHIDPRLSIRVEDTGNRTLEDVAGQMEADFIPPDMEIPRGSITVDGVDAFLWDNLPGQDLNRRVIFIQNGRLYKLFFAPLGEEGTETRSQAEGLYQLALDSFRFLEETVAVPTPDPSTIPVVETDVQYVMADQDINIRSGPGTDYEVIGGVFGGQIALVTGVTEDGEWWRVICPDDSVGNCFVTADPAFTQPMTPPSN